MKFFHLSVLAAAIFLVPACESYPLGMSKDEWVLLSPEQQAEARQKQLAIDAEQRRIAALEEENRQRAAADAAAKQDAELDHRYRHARYGDIVSVNIEGGTMKFDDKDRKYEEVAFDLVRGEAREIIVHREDRHSTTIKVVVRLSEDGRKLYFDDASDRRLTLTEKSWDASGGQIYTSQNLNNDNSDLRGATIRVRYKNIRRR